MSTSQTVVVFSRIHISPLCQQFPTLWFPIFCTKPVFRTESSFLCPMCCSNSFCFLGDLPWRLPSILKLSQDYAASEVCLSIIGLSFQSYPPPHERLNNYGVIYLSLDPRKGKQPKRLQETQETDWFWLEEISFSLRLTIDAKGRNFRWVCGTLSAAITILP